MTLPHPHDEYQATHRMPRILIVANQTGKDGESLTGMTSWFASETDCLCLKFVAKGEENVHVLMPQKYEGGASDVVRNVFAQSVQAGRPYDVIIVDSEACGREIMRLAQSFAPKPAVAILAQDRGFEASALRRMGLIAFDAQESNIDMNTGLSVYDAQLEKALGPEGMQRLVLKPDESSAKTQWLTLENGFKEVQPVGVNRRPGNASPGLP